MAIPLPQPYLFSFFICGFCYLVGGGGVWRQTLSHQLAWLHTSVKPGLHAWESC